MTDLMEMKHAVASAMEYIEVSHKRITELEAFVRKVANGTPDSLDIYDRANAALDWEREAKQLLGIEIKEDNKLDDIPF